MDPTLTSEDIPQSKPHSFELILPPSYENYDQFKAKMLLAISKGCGLEPEHE